jgi:SSS family solute:Na+ symporter
VRRLSARLCVSIAVLLLPALARADEGHGGIAALDWGVLVFYLLTLVAIGLYFARRENSTEEYFVAGRTMPWWAAGVSIFGTQLSAITFLAVPAKAFAVDWVYFLVNMTIIMVAPVVVFLYLPFLRGTAVTSAYEYLEKRFSLGVRMFGAVAFLLFQIGRMGIILFLPAIVLATVTGVDVMVSIVLMGILATAYTTMGGIRAVIWTDVSQVVVLMGAAVFMLVIADLNVEGGLSAIVSRGLTAGKFNMVNWSWDPSTEALWVVVVGNVFANLIPYTADQTVVQRYLTTHTQGAAARAIWTNAVLTLPASLLFFGLGTALFVFYQSHPALLVPSLPTDGIVPLFIVQKLPAGIAGLALAGVFAASMSSLDSSINSMATVVVTDFYRRLRPGREQGDLRRARWLTVLFGALGTGSALVLASFDVASLLDAFREVLGLFGGSLAGLFALGILTRRPGGSAALAGAFSSALIVGMVKFLTDLHFFLYAGIGLLSCVAIGYGASFLCAPSARPLEGLTWSTRNR